MTIVGCDFHPSWQQVSVLDTETGEISEHKLVNGDGEAERFYCRLRGTHSTAELKGGPPAQEKSIIEADRR